jgi:hypothetical protein
MTLSSVSMVLATIPHSTLGLIEGDWEEEGQARFERENTDEAKKKVQTGSADEGEGEGDSAVEGK